VRVRKESEGGYLKDFLTENVFHCYLKKVYQWLTEIAKSLITPNASVADTRFLFILPAGNAGIFRKSGVLNIRVNDIQTFWSRMTILVKKKKDKKK